MFLRFHSFSQVVKWPEFVRSYTANIFLSNVKLTIKQSNTLMSALSPCGPGFTPDRDFCIAILIYIPVCILSSKTNNFGKDSQPKLTGISFRLSLHLVFCLPTKILWETQFFFRSFKTLLVVQILEVTVYQENAEHVRLISFHWQSEKVEMGGTCLGEQKSIQQKVVFNSCKLCYYTQDNFTRNCVQGFSDIQRNEKVLL